MFDEHTAALRKIRDDLAAADPGWESPYCSHRAIVGNGDHVTLLFRGGGKFRMSFGDDEGDAIIVNGIPDRGNVELWATGERLGFDVDKYRQPYAYIRRADERFSGTEPTPSARLKLFDPDGILLRYARQARAHLGGAFDDLDAEASRKADRERAHRAIEKATAALDEALSAIADESVAVAS